LIETLGVLLAGGQSRRFGSPKAFATYKGKEFWEYSLQALKSSTESQAIISHPSLIEKFKKQTNIKVLYDDPIVQGKGPLAGIYTAMKDEKAEWFVFLSCDIPLITDKVLSTLLTYRSEGAKIIIPKINGKLHPLIGIYHYSIQSVVEKQLLNNELKVMSLFEKVPVYYVLQHQLGVESKIFSNINSPNDYVEILKNDKIAESD